VLYHFLVPLARHFKFLNLFAYITFRAAGAAVTALVLAFVAGPIVIGRMRRGAVTQGVRDGTPETHAGKGDTPTMGGLIILFACIASTLLWARLGSRYIWLALIVTTAMGAIGLVDDMLKLRQKRAGRRNEGLVERYKLAGQVTIGLCLGLYVWQFPLAPELPGASTTLPFFKYVLVVPISAAFAWVYVVFTTFVLTGVSNAVNLTDGLDGLAAGLSAIAFATFAAFAYVIGRVDWSHYLGLFYLANSGELTVFCSAMAGALLAFLWFNTHPAQVFMGDVGALALGGAIGFVGLATKTELSLPLIGGVFVVEALSDIIQVGYYKRTKKRIFLMAPIHHHFEKLGWPESRIVVRFWIVSFACAILGLITTLKVR